MPSPQRFVVDRVEGEIAVLLSDGPTSGGASGSLEVPKRLLARGCGEEGAVVTVPLDAGGAPQWEKATRDLDEEKRRNKDARDRLQHLQRDDPGGDIVM